MTSRLQIRKSQCKVPLFTYGCTSQGVKHWLFFDKYRIKIVKVKDCKIKLGVSKTFQTRHSGKVGCLDISNVVNTKVAEFFEIAAPRENRPLILCKKD